MGRQQSKKVDLTSEQEEWLRAAVSEGMPLRRIAVALERSPSTIRGWIEKKPALLKARLEYELRTWSEIARSKEWRAKAWILSRLAPGVYNEVDAIKTALKELAKEQGLDLDDMVAILATAKARSDGDK